MLPMRGPENRRAGSLRRSWQEEVEGQKGFKAKAIGRLQASKFIRERCQGVAVMSTPSGKPFDPFDLSPYAPRRARERSGLDAAADASEDNEDIVDSSHNRDAGRRAESDMAAADPMPYAPRAAPRPEAAGDRLAGPDGGVHSQSRPVPPDQRATEKSAGKEPVGDVDLARLEASLQWLQREGAAERLPRAVQLPPVSGLRPVSPEAPRARGEHFINGVRVPPSLAPERLRPPPLRERRDNLRGPLRVLLAGAVAAPIAYYFSIGNPTPVSEPAAKSGLAAFASRLVASTEFPVPKEKLRPGDAEDYNTVVSSRNKLVASIDTKPAQSAALARVEAPAALPRPVPDPAPAAAPVPAAAPAPAATPATDTAPAPAAQALRELDSETIRLLMQQGEQFVASGDLVTARLVYLKAAEAGNAAAALALGATYDPVVLAKIGVRGMGADVEKARSWYEKAKAFGSPEAPRRLEMLANR
jgi:hypothetical protein